MLKLSEREHPESTWNKTEDHEPVFLLCARDSFAPAVVRCWISIAAAAGVDRAKITTAEQLLADMMDWQRQHGCKVPD